MQHVYLSSDPEPGSSAAEAYNYKTIKTSNTLGSQQDLFCLSPDIDRLITEVDMLPLQAYPATPKNTPSEPHSLSELKHGYFENYQKLQAEARRNLEKIGQSVPKIDISEIRFRRESNHSLMISATERQIQQIESIVEQIKEEHVDVPNIQYDISDVAPTKQQQCQMLKQYVSVLEHKQFNLLQQMQMVKRHNYELSKRNSQLQQQLDSTSVEFDNYRNIQELNIESLKKLIIMLTNEKNKLMQGIHKGKHISSPQKIEKHVGEGKKYDSMLLRLTDQNSTLKSQIETMGIVNKNLLDQLKCQKVEACSIAHQAQCLRKTLQKVLKNKDVQQNSAQVNSIRNELKALVSKIDVLNCRANSIQGN